MKVYLVESDDWGIPASVFSTKRRANAHIQNMRYVNANRWSGEQEIEFEVIELELDVPHPHSVRMAPGTRRD